MKMLPVQLSLNPPLGLWSDVLWRCPPAPPSQLAELKTQLPASLPSDPKLWGREDVTVFLQFCEREFDLPKVDLELFQMNGKALCLLTRADFGHRCPGAGDVLHNVLQMLIIESHMMQWHLPNSPVTPTSRYPLSPHSHPSTPTWPPINPTDNTFNSQHMHHFMAPNSVTLSPPPSVDSQASSPPQSHEQNTSTSNGSNQNSTGSGGSSNSSSSAFGAVVSLSSMNNNAFSQNNLSSTNSNHSDSDEDSYNETTSATTTTSSALSTSSYPRSSSAAAVAAAVVAQYKSSPPTTPILKEIPQSLNHQLTNNFVNSWSQQQQQQQQQQQHQQQQQQQQQQQSKKYNTAIKSGSASAPTTPSYMPVKREFFPDSSEPNTKCVPLKREFFPENSEPNTNGRLLWDFLQQLLNDRNQKYSDLIAWKCRDTGVFKIVDPAGLAKLWGIQKNHLSMNYDKMSRALRYYYRVNILRKVQGERHCYQFLRNPTELKNIKNISLLRQTINNNSASSSAAASSSSTSSACNGGVANNGGNSNVSIQLNNQAPHQQAVAATNVNSTNWSIVNHQNLNTSMQQTTAGGSSQQQSPAHRSLSSSSRSQHNNHHQLGLPALSSQAAAAVAAAAAYGPPPTSPLFMHAINGAFHYLSSASNNHQPPPPPSSPPVLPSTPSEKLQFSGLNLIESNSNHNSYDNNEEMKPTDLSVTGTAASSEKRPYAMQTSSDECYPLIRNADGLTTIKLIRYSDNETATQQQVEQSSTTSSLDSDEKHCGGGVTSMDNEDNENGDDHFESEQQQQHSIATDLSK